MSRNTTPITGICEAECGCLGDVFEPGTRLTGTNRIVTLKVTVPCTGGHPYRVMAGVLERFTPDQVKPAAKSKVSP